MSKFEPIARLNTWFQRDETRIYILQEELEMDAGQTVNGLKCWVLNISSRNSLGIRTPDFSLCYNIEQRTLKYPFVFFVKQAV